MERFRPLQEQVSAIRIVVLIVVLWFCPSSTDRAVGNKPDWETGKNDDSFCLKQTDSSLQLWRPAKTRTELHVYYSTHDLRRRLSSCDLSAVQYSVRPRKQENDKNDGQTATARNVYAAIAPRNLVQQIYHMASPAARARNLGRSVGECAPSTKKTLLHIRVHSHDSEFFL